MNTFTKPIFVTALILLFGIGAASPAFAKGYNQGFSKGLAGQATAGAVDDGQTNREGNWSATSYGITNAVIEAQDGIAGNSIAAQNKGVNHPSTTTGRVE
jgi:hypothetical protein